MLKRNLTIAAATVAGLVASVGSAAADSGSRQDDLAPHSTAPVSQLVGINGDTNATVTGVGCLPLLGNAPAGSAKTGPQQVCNEEGGDLFDAPVSVDNGALPPMPLPLPL